MIMTDNFKNIFVVSFVVSFFDTQTLLSLPFIASYFTKAYTIKKNRRASVNYGFL